MNVKRKVVEKKKNAVLVTLADKTYIEHAKQLFSSAYWEGGWTGDYLLLAHEIPEKDLAWFRKKGILVRKCSTMRLTKQRHSVPAMSKLYLFDDYFRAWKKVIYLDVDILVRRDITPLAATRGFRAVQDVETLVTNLRVPEDAKDMKLYNELKKKFVGRPYFNSGVMAFDTSAVPKNAFQLARHLHKRYMNVVWGDNLALAKGIDNNSNPIILGDQAILNIVFYEKWKPLPAAFNIYLGRLIAEGIMFRRVKLSLDKEILKPIIHCCSGHYKPWDKRCVFHEEWKVNMKKAESMNIKKSMSPIAESVGMNEIICASRKIKKEYNKRFNDARIIARMRKILMELGIYLPVIRAKRSIEKKLGRTT